MISSWRRRRSAAGRGRAGKKELHLDGASASAGRGGFEVAIPSHFRCPITLDLMKDPVTLTTGITYDRPSIETWLESGNVTCPITNQVLRSLEPIPNHTIRRMIQDWCVQNKSFGIERIPTPRTPMSSVEAAEALAKLADAAERRDEAKCREILGRLRSKVRESERNKRCVVASGAAGTLSAAFEAFAKSPGGGFDEVLEEILSALTLVFPLVDEEAKSRLGSEASLRCMVRFLEAGDLSRRRNSVLVIKHVVASDQRKVSSLAEVDGALEALVKLVREPICPTATKASLMALYHAVSSPFSNDKIRERLVEMGLVSLAVEMLVDSERSLCDKALGVLDGLAGCARGREAAHAHALVVPVLVKKVLRVSDLATELSISVLWKLCKGGANGEEEKAAGAAVEALRVGAFQKLLLVLQVGCGERVKEKTSDLLKALNAHRGRVECIESMDFKDLKRPF